LRSLASFADSVGIEVLYEGVETERQLDICISSKGRYYQGFFIALPQSSMRDMVINSSSFSALVENAYMTVQNKALSSESLRNSLDDRINSFLIENPFDYEKAGGDMFLIKLFRELPDVLRIYLCGRRGVQLSNNIERNSGGILCRDYKNKNWAWRGYFHETIAAFAAGRRSCLSNAYRDFTTKEQIFTYCFAFNDDVFLFADITKDTERMNDNASE
jgi:hypothetical protein